MATMTRSIRRSAAGLGLFAVITGGTIAVTQALTEDRITEQAARAEAKALFEIIPERDHDNDLLGDTVTLPAGNNLPGNDPVTAWVARRNGQPVGMIMPTVAPDGYSGEIKLLVGINPEGTLLGVRVISHRETPGLGDRIETRKSNWINGFTGKSLDRLATREWKVKKNGGAFDQFTGATITPSAVVKAVKKSLVYFRQNRQAIRARLNAAPSGGSPQITPDDLVDETLNVEQP